MGAFTWFLKRLDMAGASPGFRINTHDRFKSVFSGLLTLFVVLLLAYFVLVQFAIVVLESNVNSVQTKAEPPQHWSVPIKESDFKFAIGFTQNDKLIKEKMFDVSFKIKSYDVKTSVPTSTTIQLESCTTDQSYWKYPMGQYFPQNSTSQLLCLPSSFNLQVTKYVDYFIIVKKCNQTADTTCKYDTNSQNITTDLAYSMMFYYVSPWLNQTSYQKPFYPKAMQMSTTIVIPAKGGIIMRTQKQIWLTLFTIITDQNRVFTNMIFGKILTNTTSVGIFEKPDNANSLVSSSNADFDNLVVFYLTASQSSFVINRTLPTLLQLIINVNSVFQTLIFFIILFGAYFANFNFNFAAAMAYFDDKKKPLQKQYNIFGSQMYYGLSTLSSCSQPEYKSIPQTPRQYTYKYQKDLDVLLDLRTVLIKLQFFERAIKYILGEQKYYCLFLKHPETLNQSVQFIKNYKFYREFLMKQYPKQYLKQYYSSEYSEETVDQMEQQKLHDQIKKMQQKKADRFWKIIPGTDNSSLDTKMKNSLDHLKSQLRQNQIAQRIYADIDDRAKQKYLNETRVIPSSAIKSGVLNSAEEILHYE